MEVLLCLLISVLVATTQPYSLTHIISADSAHSPKIFHLKKIFARESPYKCILLLFSVVGIMIFKMKMYTYSVYPEIVGKGEAGYYKEKEKSPEKRQFLISSIINFIPGRIVLGFFS